MHGEKIQNSFDQLLQKSVITYADAYSDVAEALAEAKEWDRALVFLDKLTSNPAYDHPVVWLRKADAHRALGHIDLAIKEYTDGVYLHARLM